MSKVINIKMLKEKIDDGASSYDCARTFGVSQSTVIRRAKQHGLQFKGKSTWRNLWESTLKIILKKQQED